MKVYSILLLALISMSADAAVWSSNKHWDKTWENRYANWIATKIGPTFFKKLGSPYSKLRLDCADAHYALIAYYSKMNGLHMKVSNGGITNKTTRFDHIRNEHERLAAFIRHLAGNLGTESIAHADSYPVAIDRIKPGDLFMYKVGSNGNYTRHTYIVKNINIDGTFDVLYSTQERYKKGLPLNRYRSYMFSKSPRNKGVDRNHWGFRRAKRSHHAGISQEKIGISNFSQYRLAEQVGRLEFFRRVRSANKSINETPNRVAERNFNGVCRSIQDRVEAVAGGVSFNKRNNGRCMNERDYDIYSTPSRDSGIKDNFRNYKYDVSNVSKSKLNAYNLNNFSYTFSTKLSKSKKNELYKSCPVNPSFGRVNLSDFRYSLFAGNVSYHPNDNVYWRWGVKRGRRTKCHEYYGYPVQ